MKFEFPTSALPRSVLALTLTLCSATAQAEKLLPFPPTDAELKTLPAACAARLSEDKEAKRLWEKRIGQENYLHLHHYCFGLNFINRAKFTFDKKNRHYYLTQARGNFAYVLKNWPEDSRLRPDAEAGMREATMMIQLLGPVPR
jgi:hypothetical protein